MSTSKVDFFPLLAAGFQKTSTTAESIAAATLEPSGFEDPDNLTRTYSHTNRTITLTHPSGTIAWWWRGERFTVTSPWTSAAHANSPNQYYLTLSGNIATESWSTTPWTFDKVQVAFANFQTLAVDSWALNETHGLMPWQAHENDHFNIGTNKRSGLTLTDATYAINGTTDAQNTWGLDSGLVADEDLHSTIATWLEGTYTILRRDGVNGTWLWDTTATLPFHVVTNSLQYNQNTGATWQLTTVPEDSFVNYYVFAVPTTADTDSQKHRVWVIPGQATYTTSAAAQQEFPANLDLGTLASLSPEFVAVVRVTMRYNASPPGPLTTTGRCNIAAVTNITGNRAGQIGTAGFTPADHGSLSGLGDDDHLQYDLIAGRAGNVVTQNANFTVDAGVQLYVVDTSGGAITVTLVDPATAAGKMYTFLNSSTNNIVFGSFGIDGITGFTLDGAERIQIVSDGTIWRQYARRGTSAWKTGITFLKDSVIEVSETGFEGLWRCLVTHTASAAFSTDVATNWDYVGGDRCARWISSASHGFSAGNWLYDTGSAWGLADCDDAATSEVVGVVSGAVTNFFLLVTDGYYKRSSGTHTRGATQWLSATAGAQTETEPSTVGQISKPLGVATSTTEMNVNVMRGSVVGGANLYSTIGLATSGATTFHTIQGVAGTGGWLSGTIKLDGTGTDYVIPFFCHFSRQLDGTTYNVSPSFGDTIPAGLTISNSGSAIQINVPGASFTSCSVTYCVQAAANGTTLPVSVSASSVLGSTSGVAPAAGVIGEKLTQSRAFASGLAMTSGAAANVTATALTLTPGTWALSSCVVFTSSATSTSGFYAGTSVTSATLPATSTIGAGNTAGEIRIDVEGVNIGGSGNKFTITLPRTITTVSTNTTVYLVATATFAGGTGLNTNGEIQAIRIG